MHKDQQAQFVIVVEGSATGPFESLERANAYKTLYYPNGTVVPLYGYAWKAAGRASCKA